MHGRDGFTVSKSVNEIEGRHDELINEADLAAAAEEKETHAFEIDPAQVIINALWQDGLVLHSFGRGGGLWCRLLH